MNDQDKTKEDLIIELQKLQQDYDSLKEISDKVFIERKQMDKVLPFVRTEKLMMLLLS